MPWNRLCGPDAAPGASSITATAAASTCRYDTRSGVQRPAWNPRQAARATRTITLWLKPSTACTRLRLSTSVVPGAEWMRWIRDPGMWVGWFNNRQLLELIGDIPPAELETAYCLSPTGGVGYGSLTQTNEPSEYPGRFKAGHIDTMRRKLSLAWYPERSALPVTRAEDAGMIPAELSAWCFL